MKSLITFGWFWSNQKSKNCPFLRLYFTISLIYHALYAIKLDTKDIGNYENNTANPNYETRHKSTHNINNECITEDRTVHVLMIANNRHTKIQITNIEHKRQRHIQTKILSNKHTQTEILSDNIEARAMLNMQNRVGTFRIKRLYAMLFLNKVFTELFTEKSDKIVL